MNNSGLVSVIMPAYNAESTILESCRSVLNQSYDNIELVVVNDGSTDGTLSKIEELRHSDPRVVLVTLKNGGVSKARNFGISVARGSFIAFLDADDIYDKEKVKKQVKALNNLKCDAVISGVKRFTETLGDKRWLQGSLPPRNNEYISFSDVLLRLPTSNYALFHTALARKEVFRSGECYSESLKTGEDWDYWLRLSQKFRFRALYEELYFYRKHDASATSSYTDLMTLKTHLEIFNKYHSAHALGRSEARKWILAKYLEFFNNCLYKSHYREAGAIFIRGVLNTSMIFRRRFYEILKDRIKEKVF
ncbi:glycosyltransferase family 2 protein [Marinobacter salinexigens]|nr:glycosyltransferase family 2 protein [Marinobacter salinexigens]